MNKNYRIKDIAELAGVSTGTVDRILHNRGKVSEAAWKKVEKVLEEIDYQPNLIARSLALKKTFTIFTVTPFYEEGEYWEKFCLGIEKAELELYSYNVNIIRLYFNQYDTRSFNEAISLIKKTECQGVVIATLFKEGALELTKILDNRSIPYVLVDAYLPNTNCIAYYGTNSYDSGYIAGRLMNVQLRQNEDIAIFRFIRHGEQPSNQVQQREEGFRNYLHEHRSRRRIYTAYIHADQPEESWEYLDMFFNRHRYIGGGIIFNSRAHILGDYFKIHRPDLYFKLIGYDVIDSNIQYLNEGYITHLIAQRPEVQGVNSIRALFNHLIRKKKPKLINYMPIDILIKENIEYYDNYI